MKNSELLGKAAEIIERNGLCRGAYATVEGRVCSMGALYNASGVSVIRLALDGGHQAADYEKVWGAAKLLTEAVRAVDAHRWSTLNDPDLEPMHEIPAWNDSPTTTQEDVLLAFKRAVVLAEEREGDK